MPIKVLRENPYLFFICPEDATDEEIIAAVVAKFMCPGRGPAGFLDDQFVGLEQA